MSSFRFCPQCKSDLGEVKDAEGALRTRCSNPACSFVFWNNPTPVVAAIITVQDQVLLVHHVHWPEKMLGLVTGFLEAGEHPDTAVKREIREETSLDTRVLRFLGNYMFKEQNQLIIAYEAQCEGTIRLNEELDRYKLLPVEKLKPWAIGTGPAVRDWLSEREA